MGSWEFAIKCDLIMLSFTLPGQRGMFIIWQNFSLRFVWWWRSCEISASDIFLNPKWKVLYWYFNRPDWRWFFWNRFCSMKRIFLLDFFYLQWYGCFIIWFTLLISPLNLSIITFTPSFWKSNLICIYININI